MLVAIIGVAAFAALAQGTPLNGTGPSPGPCTPQPCLDLQGYTMWVSNVSDAGGVVRMQVSFRNSSRSTHAAPEDLRLTDSTKQSVPTTQVPAGCTHWSRTEFSNGATFGPDYSLLPAVDGQSAAYAELDARYGLVLLPGGPADSLAGRIHVDAS